MVCVFLSWAIWIMWRPKIYFKLNFCTCILFYSTLWDFLLYQKQSLISVLLISTYEYIFLALKKKRLLSALAEGNGTKLLLIKLFFKNMNFWIMLTFMLKLPVTWIVNKFDKRLVWISPNKSFFMEAMTKDMINTFGAGLQTVT